MRNKGAQLTRTLQAKKNIKHKVKQNLKSCTFNYTLTEKMLHLKSTRNNGSVCCNLVSGFESTHIRAPIQSVVKIGF